MRHTLSNGYVADWESNGNRLSLYGPMSDGSRWLEVWAELTTYVPAWGTRSDTMTEWRAYRYDHAHRAIPIGAASLDDFKSPDEIAEWLETYVARNGR